MGKVVSRTIVLVFKRSILYEKATTVCLGGVGVGVGGGEGGGGGGDEVMILRMCKRSANIVFLSQSQTRPELKRECECFVVSRLAVHYLAN